MKSRAGLLVKLPPVSPDLQAINERIPWGYWWSRERILQLYSVLHIINSRVIIYPLTWQSILGNWDGAARKPSVTGASEMFLLHASLTNKYWDLFSHKDSTLKLSMLNLETIFVLFNATLMHVNANLSLRLSTRVWLNSSYQRIKS